MRSSRMKQSVPPRFCVRLLDIRYLEKCDGSCSLHLELGGSESVFALLVGESRVFRDITLN